MIAEELAPIADESDEYRPLPEGWRFVRLGDLCDGNAQYGSSDGSIATENSGTPILRMGNIQDGRITWDNLKFIHLPEKEESKYRLVKGDILFNRTNSAELVGKTAVFDGLRDAIFASYLIRIRVKEKLACPEYVAGFINSIYGRRFIESNMTRAIGQVNISASTLKEMLIPLPPTIEDQWHIATVLEKQMKAVGQARRAVEEQLAAAKLLPSAFLRSVFESESAQSWKKEYFGNLVDNFDGLRIPLSQSERKDKKGKYPYYGASGIIDYVDDYIFDGEFMLIGEDGANLLSRSTPIAFKADGKFWVNNHAHIVKPKDGISMDYLIHFLAFTDLSLFVNGMAQPKLSQRELNRLPVLLPQTFEDQKKIAQKLNEQIQKVDELKILLTEQLKAIDKMPSALLRKAFAGEVSNRPHGKRHH